MILSINSSLTLSPLADASFEFDDWNTSGVVVLLLLGLAAYVLCMGMNAVDRKWMKRKDPSVVVIAHPHERKALAQGLFRTPLAAPGSADPKCKRKDKRRTGNPVDVRLADAVGKQPTY